MAKTTSNITDVLATIVNALTPLDSQERERIIRAALTLLGETFMQPSIKNVEEGSAGGVKGHRIKEEEDEESTKGLSNQSKTWLKKNGISQDQLGEIFHIEQGSAEVIADNMVGGKGPQKTVNAYVLQGVSSYLVNGDPSFDDKSARDLCVKAGCYDVKNHATNLKSKSNLFTGTKDSGWKLTNPGLKHGAELIKLMTKKLND
jgi:hypothetical protein